MTGLRHKFSEFFSEKLSEKISNKNFLEKISIFFIIICLYSHSQKTCREAEVKNYEDKCKEIEMLNKVHSQLQYQKFKALRICQKVKGLRYMTKFLQSYCEAWRRKV